MTTLYDPETKKVHDLSIMIDGIHAESDILGNMDITGEGTGIFYVDDFDAEDPEECECYCTTEIEARALDCDLYAKDTESAAWWVRYVDDYNERLELIDGLRERLYGMDDQLIDEAIDRLDAAIEKTEYRFHGIEEWVRGARVDYEDEHNEFMARYELLVAALDAVDE